MVMLALCVCATRLFAQNSYPINGVTVDTASKVKLQGATIAVLNARDSILRQFAYSGPDGGFSITGLDTGKYMMLVTRNGYADYVERFNLTALHDFGQINMSLKSKLLQDVIIRGQTSAIKIKGDTTEYNAKAYVIQPNDKVEDLLRQLPGIQVDQNGNITAQGVAVKKVLLDGEEFFGDDPMLVTRNIRADMVAKVQLYDKKSDQATFTGIDDGKKAKTINIQLKEDKRNGAFGKVDAGAGTSKRYQGQALYNIFRGNEKMSAYGTVATTGKVGLGYIDNNRLGSGNIEIGDNGLVPLPTNGDLDASTGQFDGKGSPLAGSAGVHYDNKWGDNGKPINANYKIGWLNVKGNAVTATQQSLPDGQINNNTTENFDNSSFRQKLDATYQFKPDTSSNLKISADGTIKTIKTNSNYASVNLRENDTPLNNEQRTLNNDGDQRIFNVGVFYTKKFSKPRRTFSWNISQSYIRSGSNGFLNSNINFYNPLGIKDSTVAVNQYKKSTTVNSSINSNITWTEPLTKTLSLVINYGLGINNSTSNNLSYNASTPGRYDVFDPVYSNNYKFNQLANQGGAVFNYKTNKSILNFGAKVTSIAFKQTNEYTGNSYTRNFLNWLPQVSYQNSLSKYASFVISYTGRTTQPNIEQLQPILINTQPLYITLGNPALKPAFTHDFSATYRGAQPVSGFNFYISPYYSITTTAIVNNIVTDAAGKTTVSYVNLAGNQQNNYGLFINLGKSIKSIGFSINFNTDASTSYSYINNALDRSDYHSYSAGISIGKSKLNKYSFNLSASPQYTTSTFSLQPQINNNAAGFASSARAYVYLPGKFQIGADVNHTYRAATQAFDAQQITLLNASISKTFLKSNGLKLAITGNDLLDQNVTISRRVTGSTITQSSYSGIKRYFLFSITWDFTKFKTIPVNQ